MSNVKIITTFVAISFSLFSLGLSGENIGLPSYLTMRNIAIIFLVLSFAIVILTEKELSIRYNKQINISLLITSAIIIWIFLSYLFSPYKELVILEDIFAWIAIPICIIITFKISKYIRFDRFIYLINIIQFTAITFLSIWVIKNVSDLSNFEEIRQFINLNITIGLNRLLNGIVYLNIFSIGIVLGIINSNKILYLISIYNVLFSFMISLITGSRQSIIAILVTILIMTVIKHIYNKFIDFNYKSLLFLIIVLFLLISLGQLEQVNLWIKERFLIETTEQLTSGDKRIDIYLNALDDIKENLLFGTGPGTYHQVSKIGMHTHNGYLSIMTNFGIIPSIILFIYFLYLFIYGLNRRKITIARYNIIFVSLIIVFTLIMNMFNDLFTRLSFWMAIVFLIELINYNYKKEISVEK